MMDVSRMRRGWRLRLTDNEFEMLREAVNRGLATIDDAQREALPWKIRKVLTRDGRWELPHGPLIPDDDRRPA
jgi:hypothetical protein